MTTHLEVHQGDIGTKYRLRVMDESGDFDPTSATVKELIFSMPGVSTPVVRTATVDVGSGDEVGQWFLTYTVTAGDVTSSPGDFHLEPGRISIQGYLEWADGSKYHSSKRVTDDDGHDLRVYPNLR